MLKRPRKEHSMSTAKIVVYRKEHNTQNLDIFSNVNSVCASHDCCEHTTN
jgi:hypothetical protein